MDDQTSGKKAETGGSSAAQGSRKLSLSVTRMKKMRSSIKAGGASELTSEDHGDSGSRPWGNHVAT